MSKVNYSVTTFDDSQFNALTIEQTSFKDCSLRNVTFNDVVLKKVVFENVALDLCSLTMLKLKIVYLKCFNQQFSNF